QELKSLGRYRIQGVLGKGAMGLVYDGVDPRLDRRVAIKTILTSTLDEATAKHYSMRFMREVRAVARLNHPNIVQVYDYGTQGDLAYIVMEYIDGRELKDSFDGKQPFAFATVLRMMGELLDALEFAHEAGVIHRDVKPANVMLDSGERVKLTDFGVARITDPDADLGEATRAGAMIGTPSYMSPEQIQGQPIDRRTDVFSAGVLFYQMLTGKKPFEGTGWALARKIVQEDPVPVTQLVQVPLDVDRVLARALAKSLDYRYPAARDFAEALRRVAQGKSPEDPDATVPIPGARSSEAELEFWNGVKDSDDPEEIKLYLEQFPRGEFAELARQKVAQLAAKG
ncbi:MAG TPA: serine/threonine-protein kinase, partial [Burkholderiales bacterium]|nr:serine/threonine-protein kinase [Burkholderiales bacterium]